jgi:curved DNA-binding protein CbpA
MPEVPIDLPPATAEGTFAKTPLVQVLVYVLERSLTGTIEVTHPDGPWASILVLEGQPSKGRTSEPIAYLGSVLHELGYIDDTTLNASLASMAKERRLHGQILRGMGKITEDQLTDGLRAQLLRKVEHLFDWPADTKFAYYDGFDALHTYGGDDQVQLDPLPLVWSAIRTQPPWEHVHAALTRVGSSAIRLTPTAQIERFEFSKEERAAADLLRMQPMRIHDLAATKLLGASTAQLLAYCLLITKQVELIAMSEAPARVARVLTTQVAQRAAVEERVPLADPRSASSPFPPHSAVSKPAAPPKVDLPPKSDPKAEPRSERGPSSTRMPAAPQRLSSGRIVTPELEKRKADIVARALAIKSEDYFTMLGVGHDVTVEQVQAAFFAMAKVWHPDRVPKAIAEVRDSCATVFAHLSEAQQTLCDPKRRGEYMHLLKDGGATPDEQEQVQTVLEAATNFQKAEFYLRRNDLREAEVFCRKAHEADPVPAEYLALLAWLEAMKLENQSPEATQLKIEMLDRAIAANERLERAHFYRGMLYKRLNNLHASVRDFRTASELNPRNLDAVREVRLFEMRKSRGSIPPASMADDRLDRTPSSRRSPSNRPPPAPAKDAGLFGKLFKK